MHRALAVFVFSLAVSACLDFGAAYENCERKKRCGFDGGAGGVAGGSAGGSAGGDAGGVAGGGATAGGGAAGGSAGGDAGGSAGGDAGGSAGGAAGGTAGGGTAGGGYYDGGLSCPGVVRPRLKCDPPIELADGGLYKQPVIGFSRGGMLYGWTNGLRFEVFHATDAGTTRVVDEVAATGIELVDLATQPDYWAAFYHSGDGTPIRCFSSHGASGVSPAVADFRGGVGISVSPTGEVALARGFSTSMDMIGWAVTDGGCPTSFRNAAPDLEPTFITSVWSPVYGFRFPTSGLSNGLNGTTGICAPLTDGGVLCNSSAQLTEAVELHTSILNSSGTHAIMVVDTYTDAPLRFRLKARSLPVDLTTPLPQNFHYLITENYYDWHNVGCGPGCMATLYSAYFPPGHVTVTFTTDSALIANRTASDTGWDIACDTELGDTWVKAAYRDGRLYALVTEPARVRLYSCEPPPP